MKLIDGYKLTEHMEFVDGKALGEKHPIAVIRMEHIINAPKIEAEPIRHGRWEMCDEEYNAYRCSVCGDAWALEEGTPAENNMHYCHYCGSKMDEEAEK